MNVQDLNAKSLNRSQSRVRSYVIIVLNGMVTCEFNYFAQNCLTTGCRVVLYIMNSVHASRDYHVYI